MHRPEIGSHTSLKDRVEGITPKIIFIAPIASIIIGGALLERQRLAEKEAKNKLKTSEAVDVFEAGEAHIVSVNGDLVLGPSY